MAKKTDNKPGADQPYYTTPSGVVFAPANMANGITGTPPPPAMRGGPDAVGSGNLPSSGAPNKANNVVKQFFHKDRG